MKEKSLLTRQEWFFIVDALEYYAGKEQSKADFTDKLLNKIDSLITLQLLFESQNQPQNTEP